MATEKYGSKTQFFANWGRARIQDTGGATTWTVGVLRNLEINVTWENVELYGMESILRKDVAKHSQKVEIKIKFASFDPTLANDFFQSVLYPIGTPDGTVLDTNKVYTFEIEAFIASFDTTPKYLKALVSGVYFENLPVMTMTENEWVARDMTAVGRTIVLSNASFT